MKKSVKPRTVLLLIAIVLFFTVLGVAFREKKDSIVVSEEKTPAPDTGANMEMKDVSYSTLGPDNTKLWDLSARTARVFDDGKKLTLEGLDVTFYRQDGKAYRLSAESGELDMETRDIHVKGQVKAILQDGATINTHSAFYSNTNRTITSRDAITITRGPVVMQGVGLNADLEAETVTILKNVKVVGAQ